MAIPNFARPLNWDECQNLTVVGAEVEAALARVASLDFSMLKHRLALLFPAPTPVQSSG